MLMLDLDAPVYWPFIIIGIPMVMSSVAAFHMARHTASTGERLRGNIFETVFHTSVVFAVLITLVTASYYIIAGLLNLITFFSLFFILPGAFLFSIVFFFLPFGFFAFLGHTFGARKYAEFQIGLQLKAAYQEAERTEKERVEKERLANANATLVD